MMSKIIAEFTNNELIIKKERHRKCDDDLHIIKLEDLNFNREYRSKIKVTSSRQKNKIILMEEISPEKALKIDIKKAELMDKNEEEIIDIKEEYEDLINKNEMRKRVVAVYVRNENLCYCYGELRIIYKRLIEFIYKVVSVNLNKNGISIFLYLYIINKFKLQITDKWMGLGELIKEDVEIHEAPGKISKLKVPFSKYKTTIKIKKSELDNEIPITNSFTINLNVNGETVSYHLGKGDMRIKTPRQYYFPIKSRYDKEYAMHIRRDNNSNLMFVKRFKEPIENTFKFKIFESCFFSFFMYYTAKFLKKIRSKKINLFYEKYAGKAEEGVFDLCKQCNLSEKSKNYFIISEDSPDYKKLQNFNFVVKKHSLKYYYLIYNSESFISSEAPMHVNILRSNNKYLRKSLLEKKFIFLQHGVTYLKPHQNNSAYRVNKEAEPSYIVAGSEKEKDVICEMLGIYEEKVWKTGLPIFDTIAYKHINNECDDFITIMLTWKPYEEHLYDFKLSSYYKNVIKICDILLKYTEKDKIYIIPHPKVLDLLMSTDLKDGVWQGPISEILAKSKLLITDYSSVAYNSFYQGAGVIFYQPDLRFYERIHGKLIPNDDEFIGKRAFDINQFEDIIKETIKDGKIDLNKIRPDELEQIHKSINEFSDGKNIERIFDKLIEKELI